jgi:glycosyltransferase involved in cell wall biosynthesis
MQVAMIARSTFFTAPGGDTVQAVQTARHLEGIGVSTDICLSNQQIAYEKYDLLHFFNLTRPADILYHSKRSGKPFVVSTILCSYTEYDKYHRKGIGLLFGYLPADGVEYAKTIARWLLGKDHLSAISYLWKGQRKSIIEILKKAAMILPNSESEYQRVVKTYRGKPNYLTIPNGVNPQLFRFDETVIKDDKLVLCVARIEGIKNQLNLVKALNNTGYQVLLIGAHASNQAAYYMDCRAVAADNIRFIDHIPQEELVQYYQKAKVHILPSWFETTGLSSVEAAVMGCNIIITDRGDAKEYFGDDAFYCDPEDPKSILKAVKNASAAPLNQTLRNKILEKYTWQQAALNTHKAYTSILAL